MKLKYPEPVSWKFAVDSSTSIDYVGVSKYGVRDLGRRLNTSGEWEYEPLPSNRTDEFKARCTFDSLDEAVTAYYRRKGD